MITEELYTYEWDFEVIRASVCLRYPSVGCFIPERLHLLLHNHCIINPLLGHIKVSDVLLDMVLLNEILIYKIMSYS
jgi:hypothetical protein